LSASDLEMREINLVELALRIPPLLFAITIHEFAHAWMAYRCGDATAKNMGRLTLNPLAHLDPMGTLCMFLSQMGYAMIGWAKPVPVNHFNFRNPRRDDILVSLAGVAANMATALTVAVLLRVTLGMGLWDSRPALIVWNMAIMLCYTSIALTIFNLIPIPPLDGSHVLSQLLPYEAARNYDRLQPYGYFILFLLVVTGVVGLVLWWPVTHIAQALLGPANIYWDVF